MAIFAPPGGSYIAIVNGGQSGLVGTLAAYVVAGDASVVTPSSTAGIVEVGTTGIYIATRTATVVEGRYAFMWDGPGASDGVEDLIVSANVDAAGAPDLALLDAAVSSRLAAGASVAYSGPVARSGRVTLIKGDDYDTDEGRALTWTTAAASDWPTLTGATVHFRLAGASTLTKPMTIVSGTGANKSVRVELTDAETDALIPGGFYEYALVATLAGAEAHVVTLAVGRVDVTTRA
jgi:hypothetical protein